jgi:hypothetical protein
MLAFDAEVYHSVLAQYGSAIWPLQFLMTALGLVVIGCLVRPFRYSGRLVASILSALWLWSAVHFHADTFATINFAAPVVVVAFVLQSLLLSWRGIIRGGFASSFPRTPPQWIGLGIAIFGLAIYPLLALPAGGPLHAAPAIGTTGVSIAIVTLGVLVCVGERETFWHLTAIPLCWLLAAGLVLWNLPLPEAHWVFIAAGLAFSAILWNNWCRRRRPLT